MVLLGVVNGALNRRLRRGRCTAHRRVGGRSRYVCMIMHGCIRVCLREREREREREGTDDNAVVDVLTIEILKVRICMCVCVWFEGQVT